MIDIQVRRRRSYLVSNLFGLAQTGGDEGVATWRLYCLYITD